MVEFGSALYRGIPLSMKNAKKSLKVINNSRRRVEHYSITASLFGEGYKGVISQHLHTVSHGEEGGEEGGEEEEGSHPEHVITNARQDATPDTPDTFQRVPVLRD